MRRNIFKGFTLVEMLVTIGIIGILAAIALPSYNAHMRAVRRTEATGGLIDLAARMERYQTINNTYVGATVAGVGGVTPTPGGYYTLSITASNATTFTIRATPAGGQASDTECASFTLTQANVQGITGTGSSTECWKR